MARIVSRTARLLALSAAASMAATPVFAAEVYVPAILDHAGADIVGSASTVETANEHRSWGGWGGRRHRDNVSIGDVLTGVLIIGGIAAIADAASRNNRNRGSDPYRYPAPTQRGDGARYGDPVPQAQWGSDRNIDRAVDACVSDVEQGSRRVETVDNVRRDGDGWNVQGQISGGGNFSCSVDRDGRVSGSDRADNGYDGTGEDDRPVYTGG